MQEEPSALLESVSALLQSDVKLVAEDYALLKQLNEMAVSKYADMATVTKSLSLHVEDLKSKYKSFEPYLAKVDEICESVASIEQTVMLLEDYTTRLVSF